MPRASHWLCATKSVTTVVCGGSRRPSLASADMAAAGVACTDTTASGSSSSSNAESRPVPMRVIPNASGESLGSQSPSAYAAPQSIGARRRSAM